MNYSKRFIRIAALAFVLTAGASAQASDRPKPPLKLKAPEAPASVHEEQELRGVDPAILRAYASAYYRQKEFEVAVQYQHWAVAGDPSHGVYDLGCYYALLGKPDAAMYWLQKAGLEEGVDPEWVKRDGDWKSLRDDDRWRTIVRYLEACGAYWKSSGYHREVVVTPKGYKPGTAIPVVIGLHGYGSEPEDFGGRPEYQALADELGVAFVGVSATVARGLNSFVWTEEIETDAKHVAAAMDRVKDRITPKRGAVVAIGFSQGGLLAAEIAARDPEYYAGAIALCPGSIGPNQIDKVPVNSKLAGRIFVVVSGSEEPEGNRLMAKEVASWLGRAKAKVTVREFEGMGHSFPPDRSTHFARWIRKVLKMKGP